MIFYKLAEHDNDDYTCSGTVHCLDRLIESDTDSCDFTVIDASDSVSYTCAGSMHCLYTGLMNAAVMTLQDCYTVFAG